MLKSIYNTTVKYEIELYQREQLLFTCPTVEEDFYSAVETAKNIVKKYINAYGCEQDFNTKINSKRIHIYI